MTHFSMGEREGRDVRKQGRQQERGSVEKDRGRKEGGQAPHDTCMYILACTQTHKHEHTQLSVAVEMESVRIRAKQ